MMHRNLALAIGLMIIGAAVPANAALIVVDHFDSGAQNFTQAGVGSTTQSVAGTMLGGSRTTTVNVTTATGSLGANVNILPTPTSDQAYVSNDSGVDSTVSFLYNGAPVGGTPPTAGLAADISCPEGNGAFTLVLLASDLAGVTATVTLVDNDSSSTSTPAVTLAGPGTFYIPYSSFTGIDFTQIFSITLSISGVNSADYVIDAFDAGCPVPEPSTIVGGLMSLVLVGVPMWRRRRSS